MTVRELIQELMENSNLDDKVSIEVNTRKDFKYSSTDKNITVFNWEGNACITEVN